MTHKNAQQLLGEVSELLKEFEVYRAQKESLFAELKKFDSDYQAGKYSYLEYEEKQKAVLRGRGKAEWVNYYNAYMYSLLKKADFIVSQAFAIVYDDDSISRLTARVTAVGGIRGWQGMPKSAPAAAAAGAAAATAGAVKAASFPKAIMASIASAAQKREAQNYGAK